MFGICLGAVALGYVAVVGMTFAGVPVVGSLAPPGVEQLARPAGDEGADVGPGAQETPLPAAAVADPATSTPSPGAQASTSANDAEGTTGETPAPSATTAPTSDPAATTTTTVTAPGEGATTSVPAPASTVPTSPTHPITAGPPTEPPGKP
jgi:hypothetical protein